MRGTCAPHWHGWATGRAVLALACVVLTASCVTHAPSSATHSRATVALAAPAQARAVTVVGMTVADVERSTAFFTSVLDFEKVEDVARVGTGVRSAVGPTGRTGAHRPPPPRRPGARARRVRPRKGPLLPRRLAQQRSLVSTHRDRRRRHGRCIRAHTLPRLADFDRWTADATGDECGRGGHLCLLLPRSRRAPARADSLPTRKGRSPLAGRPRSAVPRYRPHGDRRSAPRMRASPSTATARFGGGRRKPERRRGAGASHGRRARPGAHHRACTRRADYRESSSSTIERRPTAATHRPMRGRTTSATGTRPSWSPTSTLPRARSESRDTCRCRTSSRFRVDRSALGGRSSYGIRTDTRFNSLRTLFRIPVRDRNVTGLEPGDQKPRARHHATGRCGNQLLAGALSGGGTSQRARRHPRR